MEQFLNAKSISFQVVVVMGNTVIKYWINGHYKCVTFELTTTKTSAVPSSTTTEIIL